MKKNVFRKMLKKVKLIEKSWQSLEDFVVFSTFGTEKHTMKIEEDILPFAGLEKAYENGIVKAIGISNFNIKQTSEILGIANIPPAVNQIELHPYFGQIKLKDYLAKNGMEVEAWYPLGHGNKKLLGDPLITKLAAKYSKTPSQIILRWHIHCGNIVFPKTRSALHMRENLEIFSFGLSAEDIAAVSSLDKNKPLFSVPDWVQKLALRFSK